MSKIVIIGAGNLGTSLAKGLVKSNYSDPSDFTLTRRRLSRISSLEDEGYNITSDNNSAVKNAEIIVLAILPQKLNDVLDDIKPNISNQLIISLVSGATIYQIQERIDNKNIPIVRAMPNTAIAIGESMTCIASKLEHKDKLPLVKDIFNKVGESIIINEEQMTSATALCACGIAFFLRAIRAASQGGNEIDFHSGEALKMAAQTAKGAASLLLANNSHPEDEIDKVTSPKGCTIAGLNQMEHHGFSSAFIKGITTSAEKAGNLYEED